MDPIARLGLGGDDLEHVQEPARSGRLLAGAWRPALGERPNQDRSDVPVASSSGGGNPISWLRRRDDSGDR
jgi:hypothetical protein